MFCNSHVSRYCSCNRFRAPLDFCQLSPDQKMALTFLPPVGSLLENMPKIHPKNTRMKMNRLVTFRMDGTYGWALGTGWCQPVPKALHRHRVVTFTLVPGGTTNRCLWMSLRYRLVLPTGTLGSFMCYFKRKISIFSSKVMCRWDGKKSTRETTDPEFESRPTIFAKNTSLRHRLFYPVLMAVTFGLDFRVLIQKPVRPFLTGVFGPFSSKFMSYEPL